ncbi:MAG: carboxypeptidase regulatory-like domain-containing protein, partial [Proteobacteria bacterium]|nr:carboxypeptidase regulatory-like domain-containing protein [Pseudomonadota bacterium]
MWDVVKNRFLAHLGLTIVALLFLTSCSPKIWGFLDPSPSVHTISGVVQLGRVAGSTVRIYEIQELGELKLLGETFTNESGEYAFSFLTHPSGPLKIVATGGSYQDEATKSQVELSNQDSLSHMINFLPNGNTSVPITPFTTMVSERVMAQLKSLPKFPLFLHLRAD